MRIKSTTAFRALGAARANRAAAAKNFMVKSVNKDGTVSRMVPTRDHWKSDAFVTADEAEARRAALEKMNPGRRFTVVAL